MKNINKIFLIIPVFLFCFVLIPQHAAGLTFGYTTNGSSSEDISGASSKFTVGLRATGAAGTASSISMYVYSSGGFSNVALYLQSDSSKVEQGTKISNGSLNKQLRTINLNTTPTISAIDYWIIYWVSGDSNGFIQYDAGTSGYGHKKTDTGTDVPATLSPTTNSRKYSIYATYQEASSPSVDIQSDLIIFN